MQAMNSILRGGRACFRWAALGAILLSESTAFVLNSRHRRDAIGRARWLQGICRRLLMSLRVRVGAMGPVPGGSLMVANHLGYLDVLVLGALRPTVFVAKREVADWPVFGWFARKAGTLFIDRERRRDVSRIGEQLGEVLQTGVNVVLFLEGTSTDGSGVLPFKSSLLEPALKFDWPVVPMALTYAVGQGQSVRREVCWWGDMTLVPHLWNLTTIPQIVARVSAGRPVPCASNRKELALRLHRCVAEMRGELLAAGVDEDAASWGPPEGLASFGFQRIAFGSPPDVGLSTATVRSRDGGNRSRCVFESTNADR